ncbi:MAG TPA: hypothetical protein VFQ43_14080, partial [Nitrososphaera sp.]|nr:hypothetical protein [Nitrososphaera sp.]
YLELYLNVGLVGLLIVIAMLIAAYRKMRHELFRNFEWARYRLGFFVAVLLYNCTEAAFRILTPILLVFYIIAMDYPRIRALKPQSSSAFAGVEKTKQLAYAEEEYR